MKREEKTIAKNRRAFHDYEVVETFEAGVELSGTEVRVHNVHITPFSHGNINNPDPDRKRKLLLHKKQIRYLAEATREKGMALVPLKMYFKENGLVKVELAICRGKKLYDKRASMKERDTKREIDRALKARSR